MRKKFTKDTMRQDFIELLQTDFNVSPDEASSKQIYNTLSKMVVGMLKDKRHSFMTNTHSNGKKQVYYLSIEFLMGRSLKTSLFNLDLHQDVKEMLTGFNVNLSSIYECEPDAGLGNGGLGRLAACYLDGLATKGYPAMGYSICYEYGIFKQKLENGWQEEEMDDWLPGGGVWLDAKPEIAIDVNFDGELDQKWDSGHYMVRHVNYTTVRAIPYDMYVSGYDTKGVSVLRLWIAKPGQFDPKRFVSGEYAQNQMANAISKVLYPSDETREGKSLRLRQQYFLCAASVGDIVNNHMDVYGTLDNLHEKVAIHINDTHPTLAIAELMRIFLDDCGYSWEKSWHIVTNTFAYTNHTVMAEALEKWDVDLLKEVQPRVFDIIVEINNRYCKNLMDHSGDNAKVARMSIIKDNKVHMASLCVAASHSVNGVSKLHSEIIKHDVFTDQYNDTPAKFKNVTNGIAYRRWLLQSNPFLASLLDDLIGPKFTKDASELKKLCVYSNDAEVLERLAEIKRGNKTSFNSYINSLGNGVKLNPDSVFDVQVKRLHEYKRQHLNALNIIADYNMLLENPNMHYIPKTFIFAAKAAPSYYLAKKIIQLIWALSEEIAANPAVSEKLRICFLEDYRVTLSEHLMPASDISEQISLAGTEASGTGNMKLMLGGAVTLGTLDGANVEIKEAVGDENIIIFGMTAEEAALKRSMGYSPMDYYNNNSTVKAAIDRMKQGINGMQFTEIVDSLTKVDPYMVLADFDSYRAAQKLSSELYSNKRKWTKMSLNNIAGAGVFSADRAVTDYAETIWML
ncbi:MAG: glycogen/starch/alpha-glucan family phosphorylase [Oscillospiraceae bacterium]|nr:glycogen/starch/alpha-glucan family phosphorylase [Oscillospiraceae bacterium]